MSYLFVFFKLAILIELFLILLYATIRKPIVLIDIIFGGFIVSIYEWLTNTNVSFSLFSVQISIIDILSLYLLILMVIKKFPNTHKRIGLTTHIAWYALVAFFFISLIRGVFKNPFSEVIEDTRRLLMHFIIPVGCISSLSLSLDMNKVRKRITVYMILLVVYCIICWTLEIFGISVMDAQSDAESTMRVLRAEQTMIIAMAAVYCLYQDFNRINRGLTLPTIILTIIVVFLQHRTAWGALVVGYFFVLFVCRFDFGNRHAPLLSVRVFEQFFVIILMAGVLLLVMRNTSFVQKLWIGFKNIFVDNDTNTMNYRYQLWAGHLSQLSPSQWIIGKPFGSTYFVQLLHYGRDLTPHSAYIQTIIRCGLTGMFGLVFYMVNLLRVSRRSKYGYGEAFIAMLMVCYYPYTFNFYTSVALGLVIQTVSIRNRRQS